MIMPAIISVIILISIESIDAATFVTENFENHEKILAFLPTGIQIMLGIIAIIPIFYLGKIHDYRKEMILAKTRYFSLLKQNMPENKENQIQDAIKITTKILHAHSRIRYWMLFSTVIILGIFSHTLIDITSSSESTEKEFLSYLVTVVGLSSQFVVYWVFYEKIISSSERTLSKIVEGYYFLENLNKSTKE